MIMYKMKKEVSYRELMEIVMREIKEKNSKSGNKFEAKDAMREVADEWKKVKAGEHPDYSAKASGSSSTKTIPTKTSTKISSKETDNASIETHTSHNTDALLKEIIELCEKCKQKALQALTSKNTTHITKKNRKTRKLRK